MHTQLRAAFAELQKYYRHLLPVHTQHLEEQTYWDASLADYIQPDDLARTIVFTESGTQLNTHLLSGRRLFTPHSQFRFFLDGAQHTRLLFIADSIPVCLTASCVTILERPNPTAALQLHHRETQTALLLPDAPIAQPLWTAFQKVGLTPQNIINLSRLKKQNLTPDEIATQFELCRFLAYDHARRLREDLERRLVHEWVKAKHTQWLLVDGDLRHLERQILGKQVLGIIKRQRYQYFNGTAQALLLNLPSYQRTNLFTFTRALAKSEPTRASFFLRWRERRVYHDPLYGLIRVEAPIELDTPLADTLSQWLIAENPPSENARNGNHLYPIARSEVFAKRALQLPPIHF